MPHLLVADLAATSNPRLRWVSCNACWYLLSRATSALAMISPAVFASTGATGSATMMIRARWAITITSPGRSGTWAAMPKPAS